MGVIIDLITPSNPTFEVVVDSLGEQLACSYNYLFTDATTVNIPEFDRGRVCYYIEDKEIGCSPRGSTVIYNFCSPGLYVITQEFTIREIPNCGGTSEIIYQETREFEIEILEWQPILDLNSSECCYNINEEITFYPSTINLNNNVCGDIDLNAGYSSDYNEDYAHYDWSKQLLEYNLYYYNQQTAQWEELGLNYLSYVVFEDNPLDYPFVWEPNKYGVYKLIGTLTNCCKTVTDEFIFEVCDSVRIYPYCQYKKECDVCYDYVIDNLSLDEVTINIYETVTDELIHTIVVPPQTTHIHSFTEDNVYTFKWEFKGEEKILVFNVFCSIDKCYTNILKEMMCANKDPRCCNDSYLNNDRLRVIQAYYQTYLNLIEPYTDLKVRYSNLDVSNMLDDFIEIKRIQEFISEICDVCANNCSDCFDWDSGNCI